MRIVVASLVVLLVGGGCGVAADESRRDGRVQVVAGFAPLAEVARRVGGEAVVVTDLTPAGAEPHDLELDTEAVDTVEDADLVVYVSGGFQPAIEEVAVRTDGTKLDVLPDDAGGDPHVWLDPAKLARIAEQVRDELVDLAPADKDQIMANAADLASELDALDREFAKGLATCERRVLVTAHDAFGHLADRYDLETRSIAGTSPESEPDPATLARLADLVEAEGITTIFTETLIAPDIAETLAREAGVQTAVLDPIESIPEDETYTTLMGENLVVLRRALGCT